MIVDKRLDGSRYRMPHGFHTKITKWHLDPSSRLATIDMEVDLGPGHIVLDGERPERRTAAPPSFRPMSVVATVSHLTYC